MGALLTGTRRQQVFGLLSLLALGGVLVAVVAVLIAGSEELRGNIAFALLVISILVNVAVILGYAASPEIWKVLQSTWIGAGLACLVFTLYIAGLDHPNSYKDAGTVFVMVMAALTFPLGLLPIAAGATFDVLSTMDRAPVTRLIALWLLIFALGYFQWFKLIPAVLQGWKKR